MKKYRRVMFHDTENWCKVWIRTDSWFQRWHKEFGEFSPNHSKVQKFLFDGLFLSKVYEVWAKKYRGIIFHDTEQWCKVWINPDLVVSKMARGIGWTFIRALKSEELHSDQGRIQRFWKGGRGYSMSVAMVSRRRKF